MRQFSILVPVAKGWARGWNAAFLVVAFGLGAMSSTACGQSPPIRMDILAGPNVPATAQHEWAERLSRRVPNARIRKLTHSLGGTVERLPSPSVKKSPDGAIVVQGVLTPGGEIHLPGLTLRDGNLSALDEWLDSLSATEPTGPDRHAFGMTAEELLTVHAQLGEPIFFSTAGEGAANVVRSIARSLPLDMGKDTSSRMQDSFVMLEEMKGLSRGTTLAAALRPIGLVFVPQFRAGKLRCRVVRSQAATEFWPIGWPREKKLVATAPRLMEYVPIKITNATLHSSLQAIGSRIDLPILYDHNGLARADLDPATIRVDHPDKRTFYKRGLDRLLAQAKMRGELRLDDAEKPFYWVVPRIVKKSR